MSFKCVQIEYFSDGCITQYKNRINHANLCMHKRNFGFDAEWNFFATAHGKSPCNGIGGNIKRFTAIESLKRVNNNKIISPKEMNNFCKQYFSEITFLYISSKEGSEIRASLQSSYTQVKRIPGTRRRHRFRPIGSSIREIM